MALFPIEPFLSSWSMVGNSFDTCGLIFAGCFPPCCGGNDSAFSMSLYTESGLNYTITYNTSSVNCSKLFVPYQTELQDAVYRDRGGMFQAEVIIPLPGASQQFVANITHKNASDLLCKTQCSIVLPLPEELQSLLNTVEFCYSLKFITNIANTTLLVPDSATGALGGVPCEISTEQTANSLVVDNCMAGPYASVQELRISSSTFSPVCPEESQTRIVNYTLKISEYINKQLIVCSS